MAEDTPVLSKTLERGGSSLLAILVLFEPMGGDLVTPRTECGR